jgi:C-terminal processing protease CtpA/Prc
MRTILLALVLAMSQLPDSQPRKPAATEPLQPEQMRQDLDLLMAALEEAHGGLYRYSTKAEVDRGFAAARAKAGQPLTLLAFAGTVSEALAGVRDGHMRLELDDATNAALQAAPLLPLRVAHEAGRIVVTHNDTTADDTIRPGMELLSVNGRPVREITALILAKLSGDGFIETGKASRMARAFAQNYWWFVDQSSRFLVTARATGGVTVTATLDGVTTADRAKQSDPLNLPMNGGTAKLGESNDAVHLRFPQGDDVGVLRVRTFDGETFPSSLDAAFRTLREKGASALILDLRGNGGGVDQYGALLVSHFVPKPFRYFRHIKVTTVRPSFATWKPATFESLKDGTEPAPDGGFLVLPKLHPGVAEQAPSPSPFLGKVAVLIDGGTFSTSADVCAQLRSLTKAVFVGEETGGASDGNTSGLNAQIVLPHSGLKLKIQMYGYWNAVSGNRVGRGTLPDVTALPTVEDVLSGSDSALSRALALVRAK